MWRKTRKERRLSNKKTKSTKKTSKTNKNKKATKVSGKKTSVKKTPPKNVIPVLSKEAYRGLYFVFSVLLSSKYWLVAFFLNSSKDNNNCLNSFTELLKSSWFLASLLRFSSNIVEKSLSFSL